MFVCLYRVSGDILLDFFAYTEATTKCGNISVYIRCFCLFEYKFLSKWWRVAENNLLYRGQYLSNQTMLKSYFVFKTKNRILYLYQYENLFGIFHMSGKLKKTSSGSFFLRHPVCLYVRIYLRKEVKDLRETFNVCWHDQAQTFVPGRPAGPVSPSQPARPLLKNLEIRSITDKFENLGTVTISEQWDSRSLWLCKLIRGRRADSSDIFTRMVSG